MDLRCRLITNICKLRGDSFRTMEWVGQWTIFTSVEYGGNERGVRGDVSMTFDPPPPNVNLPGLGFWRGGGRPPSGKITKGSKLLLTFFERPPCLHPTKRVVIIQRSLEQQPHSVGAFRKSLFAACLKEGCCGSAVTLERLLRHEFVMTFRHQHIEQPAPGAS